MISRRQGEGDPACVGGSLCTTQPANFDENEVFQPVIINVVLLKM